MSTAGAGSKAHREPKPACLAQALTVVHAQACGSSGLSARALAAAMWSHATHFELIDGGPLGIADVLRVGMCPLFDSSTPWLSRLQGLLHCTLEGKALALWQRAAIRLCTGPNDVRMLLPPQAARGVQHHEGPDGFVDALIIASKALPQPARTHDAARATATLMAVDSLLHAPSLQALHQKGLLSTEELAQGLIPSEACACLTVVAQRHATRDPQCAVVRGACREPVGPSAGQALVRAILGAMQGDLNPIHTVLWDIGPEAAHLPAMAEAISSLGELVQSAQFVRPLQYIGGTGSSFGAVATVLTIEGCRAGVTTGGRTLICSLSEGCARAVFVEAPWRPNIMLADMQEP